MQKRIALFICFVFFTTNLLAQLCTGSLGDAVVNITFGNTPFNFGNNLPPANAYAYTSNTCPRDGNYTITPNTTACFNNTWHTITQDHTGNGNFLLVNASFTAGDFFVAQVTNLCPNTTYEFAAWVMNVLKPIGIRPNLTFTIEDTAGNVLQTYATQDIVETPNPTWQQYGFFFTTPINNPVIVLRIKNNAPGGAGNDLALDDITFKPCSNITLTANLQGQASNSLNFCQNIPTTITCTSNISVGYTRPIYQWQLSKDSGQTWADIPNATNTTYTNNNFTAGSYWYRQTVNEQNAAAFTQCRIVSNLIKITVFALPQISAGQIRTVVRGNSITINAKSNTTANYKWRPATFLNTDTALTPICTPLINTTYTLTATSPQGCTSSSLVNINVVNSIYIPNAITPNFDGVNDVWQITNLDAEIVVTVYIYNRVGQQVYYYKGNSPTWNGTYKQTPVAAGNYVYYITFNNGMPAQKGNLLVIK
jgi:gliding motility-associated-like protein